MMISGIVLASAGGAAMIVGGILIGVTAEESYPVDTGETNFITGEPLASEYDDCEPDVGFDEEDCIPMGVGFIMLGVGGAMATAGIIMAPIGAANVSADQAVTVEPWLGDRVGVRLRF